MLCDVTLLDWPFPSDNSEVPQFTNNAALLTYVASKKVLINSNPIVFNDVAFDGREKTALRVQMNVDNIEDLVGGAGKLNYLMMATRTGDSYNNGVAFYFIDSYDIINIDDTGASSVAMVSLNIRADPWMNSGLATKNTMPSVRPCIVEQGHVDRWDSGTLPKIYPIKEGCDGWRVKESASRIKTFNEADQAGSYIDIFLVAWLNDGGTDSRQHLGIFVPGLNIKGSDNAPHQMPTVEDVLRGDLCYSMDLKSENVLFVGPAPYLTVKMTGANATGYELSILEYRDSLGGEQWFGGTGTRIGGTGSSVWGVDITVTCYPLAWKQDAASYLKRPTKPTWSTGGIAYADSAEPALYMEPYRQDIVCDTQGMPQFALPDVERLTTATPVLYLEPAIDPGGYSTAIELGHRLGGAEYKNAGILGTRSVIDTPNANLVSNKWLDYSLGQRALDMAYKKQSAFIEGSVGMASSAASGLVMGNAAGAAAGLIGGLIGAWGTQEKYRLDTQYNDATIRNQPNQMAVQGDGSALIKNASYNLFVFNMRLDDTSMKEAASRFMLRGYNLNMLMSPDWMSRRYFNYIRTRGINLNQAIPERRYRDQVEAIFERGVTVWHVNRMATDSLTYESFDYSRENIEEALVS